MNDGGNPSDYAHQLIWGLAMILTTMLVVLCWDALQENTYKHGPGSFLAVVVAGLFCVGVGVYSRRRSRQQELAAAPLKRLPDTATPQEIDAWMREDTARREAREQARRDSKWATVALSVGLFFSLGAVSAGVPGLVRWYRTRP